jgi:hypothetical protein
LSGRVDDGGGGGDVVVVVVVVVVVEVTNGLTDQLTEWDH